MYFRYEDGGCMKINDRQMNGQKNRGVQRKFKVVNDGARLQGARPGGVIGEKIAVWKLNPKSNVGGGWYHRTLSPYAYVQTIEKEAPVCVCLCVCVRERERNQVHK